MKQKEIWLVNLDPTIGSKMKKSRPCVILNQNEIGRLPLKLIAPFTDYKEHYENVSWMVKVEKTSVNALSKTSAIDLFQIRSVSQERLIKKLGNINDKEFIACKTALNVVVN